MSNDETQVIQDHIDVHFENLHRRISQNKKDLKDDINAVEVKVDNGMILINRELENHKVKITDLEEAPAKEQKKATRKIQLMVASWGLVTGSVGWLIAKWGVVWKAIIGH